jgi:AraC-like DNA-binding protein
MSRWLENNFSDPDATVDQLALFMGMGRTSLYNRTKNLTGKSPLEMIQDYRMKKAASCLKEGKLSIAETACKSGYSDPGYFSRTFRKHFGMSPMEYMKQYGSL